MSCSQQIEIEKKVKLDPNHIEQIEKTGTFVKEVEFRDTYFDKADFYLTTQNIWLRQREDKFELKVGVKGTDGSIDRYEEITNEQEIVSYLDLASNFSGNALDTFYNAGIVPFSSLVTQRRSYILDEVSIDIDIANFGDLMYRVAEFELLVSSLDQVKEAEKKIQNILQQLNIDSSIRIPAKLTYYLYHKCRKHYKALIDNQVIESISLSRGLFLG